MPLYDRVLILGGNGMLAHAFKRELSPRARELHAPARSDLDITNPPALAQAITSLSPTLILNCAAHTKVDLCDYQRDLAHAINAAAPAHAATLARSLNIPFVHFSTDFIFTGSPPSPTGWTESDTPNPTSEYGRSKLAGEHAIAAANPHAYILRTSWLYGPLGGAGGTCFPATMIKAARAGKPLSVVADQTGSPTLTLDLARTTLSLLDAKGSPGIYHIANAGETTWFDFTAQILRTFNLSVPLTPLTSADWKSRVPWSADRPTRSTLDCSKITHLLGHPLPSWQSALAEYHTLNPI